MRDGLQVTPTRPLCFSSFLAHFVRLACLSPATRAFTAVRCGSSAKEEFIAAGDAKGVVRIYSTGGNEGGISLLETAIQLGELERFITAAASHGDD